MLVTRVLKAEVETNKEREKITYKRKYAVVILRERKETKDHV